MQILVTFAAAFLAAYTTTSIAKTTSSNGIVSVPTGTKWSLKAWGGSDTTDNVALVDTDMFNTDKDTIQKYKDQGLTVICYISVGTIEPKRPDVESNEEAWDEIKSKKMDDWDEWWIDITKLDSIKPLMEPRFQEAKDKGCDGIEADNIDCFENDCVDGYSSSSLKSFEKKYIEWQIETAHGLGLALGMKNAVELVEDFVDSYDFAINESCYDYGECKTLQPFTDQGKA
eukprot:Pgem_evm1s4853